jgi:hypothetical protein
LSATIIPFPSHAARPAGPLPDSGRESEAERIAAELLGRLAAMHDRNMLSLYGERLAVNEA